MENKTWEYFEPENIKKKKKIEPHQNFTGFYKKCRESEWT